MRSIKKVSIALLLLSIISFPFLAFAQEDIEEKNDEVKTITTPLEALSLELPVQTDNPSLIITFIDPSTEKDGVKLEIDKKGLESIKSPYTLPALGIGEHILKFQFVDKYGAEQSLEKSIIIIPRAPILNTPSVETSKISFSGSALASSEILLILSTDQKIITKSAEVDSDGRWEIEITEAVPTAKYSFTAFVRKYGYASNLAESMTLEVGNGESAITTNNTKEIYFSFKDIDSSNIQNIFSENPDLVLILGSNLLLGLLLGLLLSNISSKKKENREVAKASKTLEKKTDTETQAMTLRDKLINKEVTLDKPLSEEEVVKNDKEEENEKDVQEGEPVIINEIKSSSNPESEKKEERVITKVDFLKNFKHQDPDDEKGNENEKEKEKKVKVSLTPKK